MRPTAFLLLALFLPAGTAALWSAEPRPAADLPDPAASWQPRHLIACLAALRAPLDAAPDDQTLLGRAEQAYAELAFGGIAELNGAMGPWRGYAEELSARRRHLRGDARAATFADAQPDLWLDLVRGDTRAVVEALARWPDAADLPAARALRMAATRDLSTIDEQPPATALEWYAYLTASHAQMLYTRVSDKRAAAWADPFLELLMRQRWGGEIGTRLRTVRSTMTDVGWMLGSPRIDEALAIRHLTALITGLGGAVPGGGRQALVEAVRAAADGYDGNRAEPFIAAWTACRALRAGDRGLRDAQGKHRLVGVADVACWLQDRVFLAAAQQHDATQDREYAKRIGAAFETAFPGSLFAARAARNRYRWDEETSGRIIQALRRELDDPAGVSPAVALTAIPAIQASALQQGNEPSPLYRELLAKLWPDGRPATNAGVASCIPYRQAWPCCDALAPLALAASRRDPYDQRLWLAGRFADPEYPLIGTEGRPPAIERIEAQLDIGAAPISGFAAGETVAARWEGALLSDFPGDHAFSVAVAGAVRVTLGDLVLLRTVRSTTPIVVHGHLPAGWVPLRVEWQQDGGDSAFKLLHRDAENEPWEPLPTDHLGHGADHQPGLAAAYWRSPPPRDAHTALREEDLRRATRMPWLLPARFSAGQGLNEAGRHAEALGELNVVRVGGGFVDGDINYEILRAQAFSFTPDRAGELMASFIKTPYCRNDTELAERIAAVLVRAGLRDEFSTAAGADPHPPWGPCRWVFSRMALARGDFRAMAGFVAEGLGDGSAMAWRAKVERIILNRLDSKQEPDWDEVRDLAGQAQVPPHLQLYLAWYTGRRSWEAVLAKLPDTPDGNGVLWYRALHEMTLGHHAQARELLSRLVGAAPDLAEGVSATALLAWYAKQEPARLAALPTAAPLPAAAAEEGAVNF